MTFKIILCMGIVWIGGYIGVLLGVRLKERVRLLELCELMLERIRVYLEYEKTPTRQLLQRLYTSDSFKQLVFLEACHKSLEDGISFKQAWTNSLERAKSSLALEKEDFDILLQLGDIIGAHDAKAQADEILLLRQLVKGQIKASNDKFITTGKLYRSLGVLGGIMAAIIIY